jgi:hypothetical protein
MLPLLCFDSCAVFSNCINIPHMLRVCPGRNRYFLLIIIILYVEKLYQYWDKDDNQWAGLPNHATMNQNHGSEVCHLTNTRHGSSAICCVCYTKSNGYVVIKVY